MIRPRSREHSFRTAMLVLGDFAVAWAALAAAVSLLPENRPVDEALVLLVGAGFVIALALAGFYRRRIMSRARPILMVALLIQVVLIAIGAKVLERSPSPGILIAVPLIELVLFPLWRSLQRRLFPVRPRDTILVGDPPEIAEALATLESAGDHRIRVIGYAGNRPAAVEAPWLGRLDEAGVRTAVRAVEEVICVSSETGSRGRLELLRIRGPRGFLLLASSADALLTSSVLGWMGNEPLVEVMIGCGFGVRAAIKRILDVVVAALLIPLTFPIWMAVTMALLLDDGRPVLLRQMRLGRGGFPFAMWKFRTMRAEQAGLPVQSDEQRLTRAGRLLRRYRIDELPQLLNVIAGDMSLVGPRPERPEIAARILADVPDFDLRCLVRPGIAGLAQILAEYDSRPAVKLRYDITYMCSWSLWLDVRLFFASVAAALSGSGV